MFIDKEEFEKWMRRILDRLDIPENKITKKKKTRYTVNSELLYDNQDICIMMNISKQTLQRFRSSGRLPYRRIDQKTFYLESDVKNFIQKYMKSSKDKLKDETESDTRCLFHSNIIYFMIVFFYCFVGQNSVGRQGFVVFA